MRKTHAMRVLDARGITYRVVEYDTGGAFHSADEAAALLGVDAATVYKTLAALRDDGSRGKPVLAVIPANSHLDLKALARVCGAKKMRMATQREAEQLTGMQVGGISALGLKRPAAFEVLLDSSRDHQLELIHVSAGERGVDLEIAVGDFVAVTGARQTPISA
jgi:Cys-tRNA(Pro)/Cys-tRNA(Cys) deacylase